MVSQLRIYTINRGMMDSWLALFEEHIRPLHQRLGIPVERSWVNADRTEFLWVRTFNNVEEIPERDTGERGCLLRLAGADGLGRHAHQPHRQDRSPVDRGGAGLAPDASRCER